MDLQRLGWCPVVGGTLDRCSLERHLLGRGSLVGCPMERRLVGWRPLVGCPLELSSTEAVSPTCR